MRSSRIAHRIGRELEIDNLDELFFAGMLKDSGCSNNSVRIQKTFGGDELLAKKAVKTIDWSSNVESIKFAFRHTEQGKGLVAKLRRMAGNLGTPKQVMNEVTAARCTRGAEIARMLGFSDNVADGVKYLDEHWDGGGAPYGLAGDATPLIARVIGLAQTFEVFLATFGMQAAYDMLRQRSGRWFEPELVAVMESIQGDLPFWESLSSTDPEEFIRAELPDLGESAIESDIDRICDAFALIVDAKSSFTAEHSSRVTSYALDIAAKFGFGREETKTLRRASLLHDIGKLGVSTGILEKPGKLDEFEFARIKLHPQFSYEILSRIPTFDRIAEIASGHHERLDGRGYWRGISGDEICLETRILTVSDVYDALTAERPYRGAMDPADALEIMRRDVGTAFDGECLEALTSEPLAMAA